MSEIHYESYELGESKGYHDALFDRKKQILELLNKNIRDHFKSDNTLDFRFININVLKEIQDL